MAFISVAFIRWRLLAWRFGVALAFISAFLLAYCGVLVCLLLDVALPHRPGAELQVSGLFLQFMCAPLHVLVVSLCVVVGASSVFGVFLVFFFSILRSSFSQLFEIVFWCFSWCR